MGLWPYLLSYVAGLAIAPYFETTRLWPTLTLLAAALFWRYRGARSALPLALLFFFALGVSLYHLELSPPTTPDHIRAFVGNTPVRVEGKVLTVSRRFQGGAVVDLQTQRILGTHQDTVVHGKLRLYIDQGEETPAVGSRICFRSKLRAPRNFGTPGEFDHPRHLAFQDIFVTAFLARSRDLAVFGPTPADHRPVIESYRQAIGKQIDTKVNDALAPLVRALAIGDKSGIDPQRQQLLAQSGIAHLFAISGLHIGLVAAMLFLLFRRIYQRSERLMLFAPALRVLPILLLPVLLVYLLFTGNAISTRRAFVMILAVTALLAGARQTPPLKLLAGCALLFLLGEPLMLFEPSFQLSFAGLFGILVLVPRWLARMPRLPKPYTYPVVLALTTLAASLATAPLVLLNFHMIAPAGLAANLFAVPAIGLIAVPLALAGILIFPIFPLGAGWLFTGCGGIIQMTLIAVEQLLRVPALQGQMIYASPTTVAAAFLLSSAILLPGGTFSRWRLRALVGLAAGLLFWCPWHIAPALAVTALSVGQGDCTLLSFDGRYHYLVDGGGLYSTRFDTGERLVAPALGWLGVRSLEAVVLTHDHPDHRKGLVYILQHFEVKEFWCAIPKTQLDPELEQILNEKKIPRRRPEPGWFRASASANAALWLFAPNQHDPNPNNRSLVLLAGYGEDAVLLPGDLEESGLEQLLAAPLPQPVDLLKYPHHGSRKSRPEWLLECLTPSQIFISLGDENPHGFPHLEVIYALRQKNLPCWRTDLDGSLRFLTNGQGWRATHWNQRLFR